MVKILPLIHLVILLGTTTAEYRTSNYINTKKLDISLWHELFPSRYFDVELKTLVSTLVTVKSLARGMSSSLRSITPFQHQELDTAELLMPSSDAYLCVENIIHFVEDSIDDEKTTYLECTADVNSEVQRLLRKFFGTKKDYLATYNKTLHDIDSCGLAFSQIDSYDLVKSCVDTAHNKYFAAANKTRSILTTSSSMNYFLQTVVECASTAAENVASKEREILGMVLACSTKKGIIDPKVYAKKLAKQKIFHNTLLNQIKNSQVLSAKNVGLDELIMEKFYRLHKNISEQQFFELNRLNFHLQKCNELLSDHYDKITDIYLENQGSTSCIYSAETALDVAANNEARNFLDCDISGIDNTTIVFVELTKGLVDLSKKLGFIGDIAILNCLSRGYIFIPGTIEECFKLRNLEFNIQNAELRNKVAAYITVLEFYADNLEGYNIPCRKSARDRLMFEGDSALYNLRRCLHTDSEYTYDYETLHEY